MRDFLWVYCTPRLTLHCLYFNVQLQSGTDFSAYSKKHMVWVSSLKVFVWPQGLWWASGFSIPLSSANTLILFQKWNFRRRMCATFANVLTDQWLLRLSQNERWWICHFPFYSDSCHNMIVSSVFLQFLFNSVNTCCLILWRSILVILKELRVSECFV